MCGIALIISGIRIYKTSSLFLDLYLQPRHPRLSK
ncbi:hypothetical protein CIPAW_01G202200 [Carya illinoinensis]|uniref:Uncharacterized protein n=1 Tax=Carya illinoinensis TaxID=32201 RepID=A0A8T1RSH3_CARIL|nr:hypothetical protein CIPAW_01G202200 [Carya illinoinensis]